MLDSEMQIGVRVADAGLTKTNRVLAQNCGRKAGMSDDALATGSHQEEVL